MIGRDVLRGLSIDKARCYGMPHFMAYYASKSVASNRLEYNARCIVCGRRATNSHHHPPRGTAAKFTLYGQELKPALLAVCGSGTTGCHGLIHSGKVKIRWTWDSHEAEKAWFSGRYFAEGVNPHDEILYKLGHWEVSVTDGHGRRTKNIRL